ncbi:GTPase Era, mitochondrial isoform X2 [Corythoichthys intestinalis]|uniref:GTPase Era, mitochondrial isoform X2 n=1 Tax=Corythoichthys intestinalis TaxID=161448 RepID=UPI0025A5A216|nr:GTPase Era, mitochondrial isoform X2 [Corythoichthys intestinalis]
MAFRVCRRIFRCSAVISRQFIVPARKESAQWLLTKGNTKCCSGRSNSFSFNPACSITSDAFVSGLLRETAGDAVNSTYRLPGSVPPDRGEQMCLLLRHPDQPEHAKVLKVAIIGAPNAGKSTLSNQLLGRKVFAVSKKVHTTRKRALGVLTEEDTQIILLDTPGLTTPSKVKRHHLEKSLLLDPWSTVKEADLMVIVVDVSDRWMCRSLDFEVDQVKVKDKLLSITAELTCGVVNGRKLRIRPVIKPPREEKRPERDWEEPHTMDDAGPEDSADIDDSVRAKEHMKVLRNQKGWPGFKDVFMLSSLDKEDVETLKSYLVSTAKSGAWQYHSEVLTDQNPEEMCINIIREKLLEHLPQEVPYAVTQFIELWDVDENGPINILVKIQTSKETHMRLVIGTAGEMIARIAKETSDQLTRLFLRQVNLKLSVKMKRK